MTQCIERVGGIGDYVRSTLKNMLAIEVCVGDWNYWTSSIQHLRFWGCSFCSSDLFSNVIEMSKKWEVKLAEESYAAESPVTMGFLLWHATHAGSHSQQNSRTSLLRGFRLVPCPYAVHGCEAGTLLPYSNSACFDTMDYILIVFFKHIEIQRTSCGRHWQLCIHRCRSGFKHKKWTATRRCERSQRVKPLRIVAYRYAIVVTAEALRLRKFSRLDWQLTVFSVPAPRAAGLWLSARCVSIRKPWMSRTYFLSECKEGWALVGTGHFRWSMFALHWLDWMFLGTFKSALNHFTARSQQNVISLVPGEAATLIATSCPCTDSTDILGPFRESPAVPYLLHRRGSHPQEPCGEVCLSPRAMSTCQARLPGGAPKLLKNLEKSISFQWPNPEIQWNPDILNLNRDQATGVGKTIGAGKRCNQIMPVTVEPNSGGQWQDMIRAVGRYAIRWSATIGKFRRSMPNIACAIPSGACTGLCPVCTRQGRKGIGQRAGARPNTTPLRGTPGASFHELFPHFPL